MADKRSIVEIAGGLGNQMFQYAFYLKMKHLGYDSGLYYDPGQKIHNGLELQRLFVIDDVFVDKAALDTLLDQKQDIGSKLRRKLIGQRPSRYWEHDKGYQFKPEIFAQPKPIYLQGCWLSEKYFLDISDQVRSVFTFPQPTGKSLALWNSLQRNDQTVSIHVRRGDYTTSSTHLNIDYRTYLERAIAIVRKQTTNPSWYLFSDDIAHARELLESLVGSDEKINCIDWNSGTDSWMDMLLMSQCTHNIIANSTFSWWGAWLNNHSARMVISPADWFAIPSLNDNSIVPESWIKI